MSRLPVVDLRTMEAVLLHLGFAAVRQRGSHIFFRHPDSRTTTVPNHPGRDLARPLLREILRDIELTPEQVREVLERYLRDERTPAGGIAASTFEKSVADPPDHRTGERAAAASRGAEFVRGGEPCSAGAGDAGGKVTVERDTTRPGERPVVSDAGADDPPAEQGARTGTRPYR